MKMKMKMRSMMTRSPLAPFALASLLGCGGTTTAAAPAPAEATGSREVVASSGDPITGIYEARFAAADADAVARLYAPNARWFLSNGQELAGRDEIRETLEAAFASGQTSLTSRDPQRRELGHGRILTISTFDLALSRDIRIEGRRYAQSIASETGEMLLETDCWVPTGDSADEPDIIAVFDALDRGYRDADPDAVAGQYEQAELTLSTGRHIPAGSSNAFLRESATMGLSHMRHTATDVRVLPSGTAYVRAQFSFEMATPGGPRRVSGEQLAIMKRTDAGWRIVVELAW